jgi:hypothetical protein
VAPRWRSSAQPTSLPCGDFAPKRLWANRRGADAVAIVAGLWAGGSARLIAVLAVGLLAPLAASTMVLARCLLPAFPAIAVLAALLVVRLVRWVPGTTGKALTALCAIGLLAEPLCDSMAMVTTLARDDTRTLAGQWLSANVRPVARSSCGVHPGVVDFGSPPLVGFDRISGLPPGALGGTRRPLAGTPRVSAALLQSTSPQPTFRMETGGRLHALRGRRESRSGPRAARCLLPPARALQRR